MKAKQLKFKAGTPFINHPTEVAEIKVLTMDSTPDRPAYYEVKTNFNGQFSATFFAMNRGVKIDDYCQTIEIAKRKCQEHFDRLIKENCE